MSYRPDESLQRLKGLDEGMLYSIMSSESYPVARYILTTPETRAICNDPFVVGVEYTNALRNACAKMIKAVASMNAFPFSEQETTVLHILRGGLNFGIREALASALNWNRHPSAFISAQRARSSEDPEDWYITENAYNKVFLPKVASIIFGDVVASGTSLYYALTQLLTLAQEQNVELRGIFFVTIGGVRSEEILAEVDRLCRERFKFYSGSTVVYVEGRFDVARPESKLSIKYTGTDLLRSASLLAPEFIESQYESPSYPIERCTIYDAGSRAFWLSEYMEDVRDYWEKTLELAKDGVSYEDLLKERFPELDPGCFGEVDLTALCRKQMQRSR